MLLGESLCLATPEIIEAGPGPLFIGGAGRSAVRRSRSASCFLINQAPAVLVEGQGVREHYGGVRARRILLDIAIRILLGEKVLERRFFSFSRRRVWRLSDRVCKYFMLFIWMSGNIYFVAYAFSIANLKKINFSKAIFCSNYHKSEPTLQTSYTQ